jgi:hypothetical protein
MALLLIIPSWLLLLSLVIGLCRAARLGERHRQQASPLRAASDPSARRVAQDLSAERRHAREPPHPHKATPYARAGPKRA